MEPPDLGNDPCFRTRDDRVVNVKELDRLITAFTQTMDAATAIAKLDASGVPTAPVRTPEAAFRDPRVMARGETVPLAHPKLGVIGEVIGMGLPIRFSGSHVGFDKPRSRRRSAQRGDLQQAARLFRAKNS